MPAPTGEPFVAKASFSVGTSMLTRMFGTGYLGTSVVVQYPVRLGLIHGPPSVVRAAVLLPWLGATAAVSTLL